MRTARLVGFAAVLQLIAVAPVVLAAPSQAGPQRLQVAPTASGPWGDRLERPLFDDAGVLVPGDRVTDTFYVRNGSGQPALASVALSDPDPDNELERGLRLTARLGGARADAERPADEPGGTSSCPRTARSPVIPAGGVRSMAVTLTFVGRGPGSGEAADPDLVLTLGELAPPAQALVCGVEAQAAPPAAGPGCPAARGAVAVVVRSGCSGSEAVDAVDRTGVLPDTGAGRDATRSLGLGLGFLAAGGLLLQLHRRREAARRQRPVMSRNVSG